MSEAAFERYEVAVEDLPYLQHGERSYLARVYRPLGSGPFPAVVELHGGTWCAGQRTTNEPIARNLAARGIVVASLDFRVPPDGMYPASVADANHGVRWLKKHAAEFQSRADWIGLMGSSSGGHLALLSALKPLEPSFSAIRDKALGGFDAVVPYVVALWPVICPLQRHEYLQHEPGARDEGRGTRQTLEYENAYWGDEQQMEEGSPLLALERGDSVEMPAVLYVQNEQDNLHPAFLRERFTSQYAQKGGRIETELFRGERYDDLRVSPTLASATRVFDRIAAFIRDHTTGQRDDVIRNQL